MTAQWTEILLQIPVTSLETASAIAQMTVPYGIYIEDYSDLESGVREIARIDLIDEDLLKKDRSLAVIHIYISPDENPLEAISFLEARLKEEAIPFSVDTKECREEDFAHSWKKYYRPTRVGRNMMIVPSWESYAPREDDILITLDPGMAFGTGTHATTRLCMEFLEDTVLPDSLVLDIGTGSGILSIAALLLGAKSALGIDIDETAIRVARENAQLNHVEERLELSRADLTEKCSGKKYNIVMANIVADIILRLLPEIPSLLCEDGLFIASGIIDSREEDVVSALAGAGLSVKKAKREGGWTALLIGKA